MGVQEGAYGAYAYAPDVGLRMASDLYCCDEKGKVEQNWREIDRKRHIFNINVYFVLELYIF